MGLVIIPFNDWSKERLSQNRKSCTCRTKKYGDVGDCFTINGGRYLLTYVGKTSLGFITKYFWGLEGANSPEEFIEVWNGIHPRKKYNSDTIVWFHHFRKV